MSRDETLIRKSHKCYDLYHKTCGEFLRGNGSLVLPYECKCGKWQYDLETRYLKLNPNLLKEGEN
jgi:hypothetical protein